jgi:hypothetical protein
MIPDLSDGRSEPQERGSHPPLPGSDPFGRRPVDGGESEAPPEQR